LQANITQGRATPNVAMQDLTPLPLEDSVFQL